MEMHLVDEKAIKTILLLIPTIIRPNMFNVLMRWYDFMSDIFMIV